MTRNDSLLYTGGSSAVHKEQRDEPKKIKAVNRKKLLPAAEIVGAEFDKEISELRNIDYLNIESMISDEHFKAELMSRKKTIERLTNIKNRLNNLLRDNKDGEQPEDFQGE